MKYITDNQVAVNIHALQCVKKIDSKWSEGVISYQLLLQFKGKEQHVKYPTELERNAMFDKICTELTNKKS